MRTIWKFPLEITDFQQIEVPENSSMLSVAFQDRHPTYPLAGGKQLCLWVQVDTDRPMRKRGIYVVGTGNPMPDVIAQFIGTALDPRGFVWHVYAGLPL